ncbi:MAG TPA: CSLREA domain-containing protein, partial [Actinomycetota bacterium]|nr:CSLREA domain-containing protein [Actinomycetota bacterium]
MTFATARVRRSTALLLAAGLLAGLLGAGGAGAATSTTTYTVNTALDSADGACTATNCSLREAILAANRRFGSSDVVKFKIPGALPATIHLGTSLPPVRDPVRIDGTTQPGYAGSPVIVVDGAGLGTAA